MGYFTFNWVFWNAKRFFQTITLNISSDDCFCNDTFQKLFHVKLLSSPLDLTQTKNWITIKSLRQCFRFFTSLNVFLCGRCAVMRHDYEFSNLRVSFNDYCLRKAISPKNIALMYGICLFLYYLNIKSGIYYAWTESPNGPLRWKSLVGVIKSSAVISLSYSSLNNLGKLIWT